jgi:RecA-family ATPase
VKVIGIEGASEARKNTPQRIEVVKGLLHEGGTSVWLAAPKTGKSTVTRQLAVDVATGQPFFGRATRQGRVLLAGLEDDERSMGEHLDGIRDGQGEGSLFLATGLEGHGSPVDELARALKQIGEVRLVILDTLQRFACLPDMNDYAQVAPFMARMADLAKTSKAHIALVHHSRKRQGASATETALGSTAIVGGVDVPIVLSTEANGLRAISSDGGRYTRPLEKTYFRYNPDSGRTTLADSQSEVRDKVRQADIDIARQSMLTFIAVNPNAEQSEVLGSIAGVGGTQRHELLQALVEGGEVERTGNGRRGDPFRFSLKTEGVSALLQ